MRTLETAEIAKAVREMALEAAYFLGEEERMALRRSLETEESPAGREVLRAIVENFEVAEREQRPLCQDTGLAVVFLEIGPAGHLAGEPRAAAVDRGVSEAYAEGYLRKSVLGDPVLRVNTKTNTPAVLHTTIVPGEKVRIIFDAKGGGCENTSRLMMLRPADGARGVIDFAVETVRKGSGNPCPPVIVGVGIGGNFEVCTYLAKRALIRSLGEPNPEKHLAEIEREIFEKSNATGVGPMGLGGRVTVLAVHVEAAPCHIASLPVAVNIDCHSHRHRERVL